MIKKTVFSMLLSLLFVISLGCGNSKSSTNKNAEGSAPTVEQIPKGEGKVVMVFPAGAGAGQVIADVLAKFEADSKINKSVGKVVDHMGGISSGALAAGVLMHDSGAKKASDLSPKIPEMVRTVFPDVQKVLSSLKSAKFTLAEMELLYSEIINKGAELEKETDPAKIVKKVQDLLGGIANSGSILPKLAGAVASHNLANNLKEVFDKTKQKNRGTALKNYIETNLMTSPGTFSDDKNKGFSVFASDKNKKVWGTHKSNMTYISETLANEATNPIDMLVASAAVPGFLIGADFTDSKNNNLKDLDDGVVANGTNGKSEFDPLEAYVGLYKKMYAKDNITIIYVNNGAKLSKYTSNLKFDKNKVASLAHGDKKINIAVIDTKVVDNGGKTIFNISGFYEDSDVTKALKSAADKAIKTPAFEFAKQAIINAQ